jgi:hypothetical protein
MTNIVMVCKNRPRLLEQSLSTLVRNTDSLQYNLTIVDDASSDFRVDGILQQYEGMPNVTSIRIEKSNGVIARAKNLGVYWSEMTFGHSEWLYISDSDVYFTSNWLEDLTRLATATEQYGFCLWGGQIHPFHRPIDNSTLLDALGLLEYEVLDGPSWLMRWRTWNMVEGLLTTCAPGPCQSEDADFCAGVFGRGGRIGVPGTHVVIHTGLTNTNGEDAPGRKEREALMIPGVIYE